MNFHQVGVLEIGISYVDSVQNITSNIYIQFRKFRDISDFPEFMRSLQLGFKQ